jgi:5,10-methylenetetrahydromethanopterin reductase
LPGPDDADVVRAQVASLGGYRVADTTGTLGEELTDTMAKPLRIGSLIDMNKTLPDTVTQLQRFADAGLDHAFATQIFGHDALTLLAAAGAQVPGIGLGTGVVPVYPRHPMMLAQQALTVQAATGNRLILGIGLSHQVVVEGMWGYSFDKPARYMKEYLASLMPLLHGETVMSAGERVTTNAFQPIDIPDVEAPPVLVAALGDTMLSLAGRVADGTITWMTGTKTIESHIGPTIRAAAEKAGRPAPRIGASLPISVTTDVERVKERANKEFAIYPTLPSYKAMLDKEGVEHPADIAFIGDEDSVIASIEKLAAAGATDFVASIVGNTEERGRTLALLSDMARSG